MIDEILDLLEADLKSEVKREVRYTIVKALANTCHPRAGQILLEFLKSYPYRENDGNNQYDYHCALDALGALAGRLHDQSPLSN